MKGVAPLLVMLALSACQSPPEREPGASANLKIYESPVGTGDGSGRCAWFGTRLGDAVYFGISGFWAGASPEGGLAQLESAEIGHFDLLRERFLPRISPGKGLKIRSGIWDLVPIRTRDGDAALFFTSLGGRPGWISLPDGANSEYLSKLRSGSNEVVALPEGEVAYTDYDSAEIVILGEETSPRRIPLRSDAGVTVAPKSLAYDPRLDALWITTDLLPTADDTTATGHDARVHDLASGREIARVVSEEIQMMGFSADGTGFFAFVDDGDLYLERRGAASSTRFGDGERRLLDAAFEAGVDFAQELVVESDGRVVITRWSGALHVIDRRGAIQHLRLPRPPPVGLYYSAFVRADRVCATYCSGVRVVCADLPT